MQSSDDRARGAGDGPERSAENRRDHGAPSREVRHEDPWCDPSALGWEEPYGAGSPAPTVPPARGESDAAAARAREVYVEVQRSAAFQEVRGRYRRFVVPGVAVFLSWYVAYVIAATTAPGLMARPVVGAVNVAMLAGLGQFLTTFLLTWAYTRHARLRRDRAALELRWDTQELTRETRGGAR
ncbi:DUF485 domain-containing protein [Streptomyces griseofuscus]|uniref:DUF485 domain-containing protein n=1 Tax=Streptomyces TaxID=1883 RepID=UPI00081E1B00|nr:MULTISPECIES: DUF485 domain-containing protein [unclassified Streptomyces]MBJ7003879.1 DUF485 domain-containing protein [Streptomyces sp. CRPSP2-6A1]SCF58572.1 Uncharacterized membrane protein, DUF485 family [Streptomyces sp. DconLS]SCF96379.1 Uncharacterized membrane protein, DUF485 family [Streptomyces sp. LamerLS-31b]